MLSNSKNFADSLGVGTTGDPLISAMIGNLLQVAVHPGHSDLGTIKAKPLDRPALKLQATADCTSPDPLWRMNLHFTTRLTEIVDLVRYRGTTEIASATAVEVPQFNCSIARHDLEMRAFDIKKKLQKFAKTDFDFTTLVGIKKVEAVVATKS